MDETLISPEYRRLQQEMHRHPQGYGCGGAAWAEAADWLARRVSAGTVLDYGCGRGTLARDLSWRGLACEEYDPAVDGKTALPTEADLVVCTDVLEHVEREKVPAVLRHIRALARKGILAAVSLRPADKALPDGRNAHITLEPADWWMAEAERAGWQIAEVSGLPLPARADDYLVLVALVKGSG